MTVEPLKPAADVWRYPLLTRIGHRALEAPDALAIADVPHGLDVSYSTLAADVLRLAAALVASAPGNDLQEARVAIMTEKGYLAVLALLATWAAGGLAVPVLSVLPLVEQSYIVENSDAGIILCDAANQDRAAAIAEEKAKHGGVACSVVEVDASEFGRAINIGGDIFCSLPEIPEDRRAMMLYTSGTTGRPKGVVTRHTALAAQVESVMQAWHWTDADNLLHILPLNHLHGISVALLPSLWTGASVELWDKFDGPAVWARWINEEHKAPITMFFGVPTVYSRLIQSHANLPTELQPVASKASARLRLQVSGSAPLPVSVKAAWEKEGGVGGGQVLLERYGMTETGLIATTGWEDEKRIACCVGFPMPGMEIRLFDTATGQVVDEFDTQGEIQVRGPCVTQEYWRLPEATAAEFVDGWFKTGDVGVWSGEEKERGMLKILGRSSVDIIKTGGEKVSAIEVERAILELKGMRDVAVVGVPDDEWGQVVGACIVTSRSALTLHQLRDELRTQLAAYKLPRKLRIVKTIPRNNMGKIQKKMIVETTFAPRKQ